MRKRIVIVILIILVAAGAGWFLLKRTGGGSEKKIIISGNIELTEVNIAFKTSGLLIERAVDEGDVVKKGEIIARLDRDQLLAQHDRENAALQSATAL